MPQPNDTRKRPRAERLSVWKAAALEKWSEAHKALPGASEDERACAADKIKRVASQWRISRINAAGQEPTAKQREETLRELGRFAAHLRAAGHMEKGVLTPLSFLTLEGRDSRFYPNENEAKTAAWMAQEQANLGAQVEPVSGPVVRSMSWSAVSDETCELLATELARSGCFRPRGKIDQHEEYDGWIALAEQFADGGKHKGLLALIRGVAQGPNANAETLRNAEGPLARKALQGQPAFGRTQDSAGAADIADAIGKGAAKGIAKGESGADKRSAYPRRWRSVFAQMNRAGLPIGAPSLREVALRKKLAFDRGVGEKLAPETDAAKRIDTLKDLEHARKAFGIGPAELAEFFALAAEELNGLLRPREGARQKAFDSTMARAAQWAADNGMEPSERAWGAAARSRDARFAQTMLDPKRGWAAPDAALEGAAGNGWRAGREIFPNLLSSRSWSASARESALKNAARRDPMHAAWISEALLDVGPLSSNALSQALSSLCQINRLSVALEEHAIELMKSWIAAGANPKGPKGDGEPLLWAVDGQQWEFAAALAAAGGWGSRAVEKLAASRQSGPQERDEWIQRAIAVKEEAELKRTISGIERGQAAKVAGEGKGVGEATETQFGGLDATVKKEAAKALRRL